MAKLRTGMNRLAAVVMILALTGCAPGVDEETPIIAEKAVADSTQASPGCVVDPPEEPMACTMEWRPVCGCDGVTYSNGCAAKAACVPEFKAGECGGRRD